MIDRLEQIFSIQKQFSSKLFHEKYQLDIDSLSEDEKKKWNKEYVLACTNELYEALNELNWKTHRGLVAKDNIDNFIEESVDVLKFLLNLLIINGCDADDFFKIYLSKSDIVNIRYEQEKRLQELKSNKDTRIVVVDIDGVLNNYPNNFLNFCFAKGFEYSSIPDFKESDINNYNRLKYEFRISGKEAFGETSNNAIKFINILKQLGYTIVLLSARPYEKIRRLYSDTVFWLKTKEIKYDYLFFSKNKDSYIINNLHDCNIEFCIDDDTQNALNFSYHFKTYLVKNEKLFDSRIYELMNKKINVVSDIMDIDEVKDVVIQ